jgi:hypothetical protein
MATATYTPIATTTLGSAASSYTFSSIPSTYTDLILVSNAQRSGNSGQPIRYQLNSDTGTNYSQTNMYSYSTTGASDRTTNVNYIETYGLPTSPNWATEIVQFNNYSNTSMYKTALVRGANAVQQTITTVGLWRSNVAISSITVYVLTDNFSVGSTFTLYGIKAA